MVMLFSFSTESPSRLRVRNSSLANYTNNRRKAYWPMGLDLRYKPLLLQIPNIRARSSGSHSSCHLAGQAGGWCHNYHFVDTPLILRPPLTGNCCVDGMTMRCRL